MKRIVYHWNLYAETRPLHVNRCSDNNFYPECFHVDYWQNNHLLSLVLATVLIGDEPFDMLWFDSCLSPMFRLKARSSPWRNLQKLVHIYAYTIVFAKTR